VETHSGRDRHGSGCCLARVNEQRWPEREQWGKLTDDEIDQLEGRSEQLAGKLQERYGLARDEAERQAKDFRSRNNWN